MQYKIHPAILERVPSFCRGVVVCSGANNHASVDEELHSLLHREAERVQEDSSITVDHPRIQAWENVYRLFPIPKGTRPSVYSLVRRIKKQGALSLPFISRLVCISNLVSLRFLIPSGLVDGAKLHGDLALTIAEGTEDFAGFGSENSSKVLVGEVVYRDELNVLCRAWNSRGALIGAVSLGTQNAIIDVDGLLEVLPSYELENARDMVQSLVHTYCSGNTTAYSLTLDTPTFEHI